MPRKNFTPANRTVIFTGFREGLEVSTLNRFCDQSLSVDPSLPDGVVNRVVSSGKVYINFRDCVAARKAINVLSKVSADEICSPGSHIEIFLKEQGRASSVSSLASKIPQSAAKDNSRRLYHPHKLHMNIYNNFASTLKAPFKMRKKMATSITFTFY